MSNGDERRTRSRRWWRFWAAEVRALAGGCRVVGDGTAVVDGGSGDVKGADGGLS